MKRLIVLLVLAACTQPSTHPADTPPAGPPFQAVLDSARRERFAVDSLLVEEIDLGSPGLAETPFSVRITNRSARQASIGLDLRTTPGLWFPAGWQHQWSFEISPHQTLAIREPYHFRRLSPEGVLRVRIGGVTRHSEGSLTVTPVLLERRYRLGAGNPAAVDPRPSFEVLKTSHLDLYAYKGSLAQGRIRQIASEREQGLREIESLLGVRREDRIRLVFYPDSATKTRDTGHLGNGFASGGDIVEIYNDEVQLDPYHEIAHIVAGGLGDPPALFDEGFATYVTERLGSPALRYLGHADAKVDGAVCQMASRNELIPVPELFRFTEIGSTASRSTVSYPESASLVKYLIEEKGLARFREVYRTLVSSSSRDQITRNREGFERIMGESLESFEAGWRRALRCKG